MKSGLPFTILVVEDDEEDRDIIDEAFKQIGYEAEVKKFIDGYSLFRYLEQLEPSVYPSLIVLDNSLPRLNVEDILRRIKEDDRFKNLPVVIYSGSVSESKKDRLMQMGAYNIIQKEGSMQAIVEIAQQLKRIAESAKTKI